MFFLVIDNCKPSPCKNGGICKNQIGSYKCTCKEPYTGVNCETSKSYIIL